MKELLEQLSEMILEHQSQDVINEAKEIVFESPVFSKFISLSKEHFHHVEKTVHAGKIYFIDGGSSEIISSHAFSLFFIRIASVAYHNFTKTHFEKEDFFVFSKVKQQQIEVSVHSLSKKTVETFLFSLRDETLRKGIQNVSVASSASVIRRFLELRLGEKLAKIANKGDVIVLDGSLHAMVSGEKKYLHNFLNASLKNNVLACALSKTTSLMTDSGVSLPLALQRLSSESYSKKRWYYYPFVSLHDDSYPAQLFMVKLHPQAKHLFLFEISDLQKYVNVEKIIGSLALTSQDPVFLGYPYGLIAVDSLARVTNEEVNYFRMRISKYLSIEELEQNSNAHSILDSIKF